MVQSISRLLTFAEFLEQYPEDGRRYELIDGEIVEVRPVGDHEEIIGLVTRRLDREIERLSLPWFIPKSCCVKPESELNGYVPDTIVLDRLQLTSEPLWKSASTITNGQSAKLVIEVVSTNWQDDYAKKLEDYEALGIPEYWILDYRALGGKRYIGFPKQPTVGVYTLVDREYQLVQFRDREVVRSHVFPELNLTANQLLNIA
ncbi:Uma2 family endonuclease [Tumidithrix elongata RA019]|uniref:Uma2 family endonuclease n=1 Tax=Tumidithrix elongata BACA0141 TaxID=2716417 RepID=A0AAW9PT07_9CYAN|nr:Uma2 family endonuclease [Tumidithrix elongata RA019]